MLSCFLNLYYTHQAIISIFRDELAKKDLPAGAFDPSTSSEQWASPSARSPLDEMEVRRMGLNYLRVVHNDRVLLLIEGCKIGAP